jgi:hypothetical protein
MRLVACAVAGVVMLGTGAASAQPGWGPDHGRFYEPERAPPWERDRGWVGPLRPQQIARVLESMGLDPLGPPRRHGNLLVQRATDDYGRVMRVTINMDSGAVVSLAPAAASPPVNGAPYQGYRPYGPGAYARPSPDDDDVEFAPRGSMMALPPGADRPPRAIPPTAAPRSAAVTPYPPPVIEAPRPAAKSATVTPAKPPLPRKRPDAAQTAKTAEPGSVAPLPATPPPAQGATPATPPGNAMPPPAPLE